MHFALLRCESGYPLKEKGVTFAVTPSGCRKSGLQEKNCTKEVTCMPAGSGHGFVFAFPEGKAARIAPGQDDGRAAHRADAILARE